MEKQKQTLKNKPFKYYKNYYEGTIIFSCNTDFRFFKYVPHFTLYKKGWFREHENEVVLMITDSMKPQQERHKFIYNIQSEKEGLKIIKDYIKKLKEI